MAKLLKIDSCRECYNSQWLGNPNFNQCVLTKKELDYLDIPDWCPLEDAPGKAIEEDRCQRCGTILDDGTCWQCIGDGGNENAKNKTHLSNG